MSFDVGQNYGTTFQKVICLKKVELHTLASDADDVQMQS